MGHASQIADVGGFCHRIGKPPPQTIHPGKNQLHLGVTGPPLPKSGQQIEHALVLGDVAQKEQIGGVADVVFLPHGLQDRRIGRGGRGECHRDEAQTGLGIAASQGEIAHALAAAHQALGYLRQQRRIGELVLQVGDHGRLAALQRLIKQPPPVSGVEMNQIDGL